MVSRNAAIIILVVLALIAPVPVILGALFAFLKMKAWQAILLVVGIALLLSISGLATIALTSPLMPGGLAIAFGIGLVIGFGLLAVFTYAGYHFAKEIRGVHVDL